MHAFDPPCTEEMVRGFLGLCTRGPGAAAPGGDLALLTTEEQEIVRANPGIEIVLPDYFTEVVDRTCGFVREPTETVESQFHKRPLPVLNEGLTATVVDALGTGDA